MFNVFEQNMNRTQIEQAIRTRIGTKFKNYFNLCEVTVDHSLERNLLEICLFKNHHSISHKIKINQIQFFIIKFY